MNRMADLIVHTRVNNGADAIILNNQLMEAIRINSDWYAKMIARDGFHAWQESNKFFLSVAADMVTGLARTAVVGSSMRGVQSWLGAPAQAAPPSAGKAVPAAPPPAPRVPIPRLTGNDIQFSNKLTSSQWQRQISSRGWNNDSIANTINNPFTTRAATNRTTGNAATAFYNKNGSYVIRDNVTGKVVQVSNMNASNWAPDPSIINPFLP